MNKKESRRSITKLAVDINELTALLGCGKATARKIGEQSGAKFKVGRRALYRIAAVESYLEELSNEIA